MFIQVIEGKTHDPEALHRQIDVWERDLKRGAIGYLGSTAGCVSLPEARLIRLLRWLRPSAHPGVHIGSS